MVEFHLRPAVDGDSDAIRRLIHAVGINPGGLRWQRFVLAVDEQGTMLGCGQLKPHSGGVIELASLAVQPDRQRRGIGTALILRLMEVGPRPLYLMCRTELGGYYERFGFQRLGVREMPRYFKRIRQLVMAYERLSGAGETLLVMKLM